VADAAGDSVGLSAAGWVGVAVRLGTIMIWVWRGVGRGRTLKPSHDSMERLANAVSTQLGLQLHPEQLEPFSQFMFSNVSSQVPGKHEFAREVIFPVETAMPL
jgi:hypothetical protein